MRKFVRNAVSSSVEVNCPCIKKSCKRYRKCKECLEHHSKGKIPAYCKKSISS